MKYVLLYIKVAFCLFVTDTYSKVASPQEGPKGSSTFLSKDPTLIYGELLNPDSLGPLTLSLSPQYFSKNSRYGQVDYSTDLKEGNFFDGVLDPRVRKFEFEIHELSNPGYFSLQLGDRVLIDQLLIRPADSLKMFLDLAQARILFAGPDAAFYEAQWLLHRERKRQDFDSGRILVLSSVNNLLSNPENKELWEEAQSKFGARLEIQTFGKEGLEKVLARLEETDAHFRKLESILESFRGQLDKPSFDLLRLELYSGYYQPYVSTLYRFYFNDLDQFLNPQERLDYNTRMEALLLGIKDRDYLNTSKLHSANYLDLQLDKLVLLSLIRGEEYGSVVAGHFSGELADRMITGFLIEHTKRYKDPKVLLFGLGSQVSHSPWLERVTSLQGALLPGLALLPMTWEDGVGRRSTNSSLLGRPSLLYFYFSTCPHSAHYFQDYLLPFWRTYGEDLGFDLIAISVDEDVQLWKSNLHLFSSQDIPNYRLSGRDKSNFIKHYEVSGYPFTLLTDEENTLISFKISAQDYQAFTDQMRRLLDPDANELEESQKIN